MRDLSIYSLIVRKISNHFEVANFSWPPSLTINWPYYEFQWVNQVRHPPHNEHFKNNERNKKSWARRNSVDPEMSFVAICICLQCCSLEHRESFLYLLRTDLNWWIEMKKRPHPAGPSISFQMEISCFVTFIYMWNILCFYTAPTCLYIYIYGKLYWRKKLATAKNTI